MDDIYIKAHNMTKTISNKYFDVDYQTQFQLCLSYLSDKDINKRVDEILSEVRVNEDEARLLEKVENYYKSIFDSKENLKFRLWKRQDKKRVYITASYIKNKPYIDLINELLCEKDYIRNF